MMQCCVISIRKSLRSWTSAPPKLAMSWQDNFEANDVVRSTTWLGMGTPHIPLTKQMCKAEAIFDPNVVKCCDIYPWSFFQGPKVQTADINGTSCTCHVANLQAMAESSYSVDVHHECCQGCTYRFPPVLPSAWCYLSQQVHSTATQRIRFHHACWTPAAAMALINYLPPFANEEDSWMSWKCWRFPNYTRMFLDLFLDNPSAQIWTAPSRTHPLFQHHSTLHKINRTTGSEYIEYMYMCTCVFPMRFVVCLIARKTRRPVLILKVHFCKGSTWWDVHVFWSRFQVLNGPTRTVEADPFWEAGKDWPSSGEETDPILIKIWVPWCEKKMSSSK